jgi:hypothetical protein
MTAILNKEIQFKIKHTPTCKESARWYEVKGYFPTYDSAFNMIQQLAKIPSMKERKYQILEVVTISKIVDIGTADSFAL